MRIIADAREAFRPFPTGKGVWTRGIIQVLLRRNVPLTLLSDVPPPSSLGGCGIMITGTGIQWHINVALRLLRYREPVVYFSPTSFIVPWILGARVPCVVAVHDLVVFHGMRHARKAFLLERLLFPRIVRRAHRICTVSKATAKDLRLRFPFLPEECVVPVFSGPTGSPSSVHVVSSGDIVCVGTLCPRKNQSRLIEAYRRLPEALRSAHRLILIGGRGWADASIVRLARSTPGVHWMGYVSDAERDRIFSAATLVVLPSLYEGFGLPVLDAMQLGIPVLSSCIPSLQELAGEAAVYADPTSIVSIRDGLLDILTNSALRHDLSCCGKERSMAYSWDRTADLLLAALQ